MRSIAVTEPTFEKLSPLESLVRNAELKIRNGDRIPDRDLAAIIEGHAERALPASLRRYLARHFRGEIEGKKGRKQQSETVKDFRFLPAANLYDRALPVFSYLAKRRKRAANARQRRDGAGYRNESLPPAQRVLEYVLQRLRREYLQEVEEEERKGRGPWGVPLGNITPLALANEISKWRATIEAKEFPDDDPNAHPTD